MESTNRLINKTIFIDTAPLIYFIEDHPDFQPKLIEIFKHNKVGNIYLQTSVLTLTEVLVRPIQLGKKKLVSQYEQILNKASYFDIYDIDIDISKQAAKLRAVYGLETPDALQIATGIEKNADYFFTNDLKLRMVSEIKILTLNDL